MKSTQDVWAIVNRLKGLYPTASAPCNIQKDYELLFSVGSPPSADARVNQVTPLFCPLPRWSPFAAADP